MEPSRPNRKMKQKFVWSPWYHGIVKGTHYRARVPGTKIEECLPEKRHPDCTICGGECSDKGIICLSDKSRFSGALISDKDCVLCKSHEGKV
jgi:hypothetical protein